MAPKPPKMAGARLGAARLGGERLYSHAIFIVPVGKTAAKPRGDVLKHGRRPGRRKELQRELTDDTRRTSGRNKNMGQARAGQRASRTKERASSRFLVVGRQDK